MPSRGLNDGPTLERLDAEECWRLLRGHSFGRICLCVEDRVQVVLTSYVVRDDVLHFRAAAFGPTARRVLTQPVTLEVDDMRDAAAATWAVTAAGKATHVADAATLASLWTPVRPVPWEVGHESIWVSLLPDDLRGRRLRT